MNIGTAILMVLLGLPSPTQADLQKTAMKETASQPIHRLVVSFRSECCGTDRAAIERIDRFIAEFEQAHHSQINFEKSVWGREGEFDYCFDLNQISETVTLAFITGIYEQAQASRLVNVTENGTCLRR
ncbi:MAG: hypothetical protein MUF72_06590 [Elainella sp. Prado103]|jgi:hypothetical protein|nr:hypothetical protein [Elainella sp. Prado103]